MNNNWQTYLNLEITYFEPKISNLGFSLLDNQVHTKGERSAFRAQKIILLGKRTLDNKKVVIKISREEVGINEILYERKCKAALQQMNFNYQNFSEPAELFFSHKKKELILITEFIEEEKKYLDRGLEEQFEIALEAFKILEGVHVVVKAHKKFVRNYFEIKYFEIYKAHLSGFKNIILTNFPDLQNLLEKAEKIFLENEYRVTQYCGFLTHFDFVPHNFRIKTKNGENKIYLLDHSSLSIGNKHEGWARFINFMSLYNHDLEIAILKYFELNRSKEEFESLFLMRVFRLFDLIHHHTKIFRDSQERSELAELSKNRVYFWAELLKVVLEQKFLDKEIIEDYKNMRDNLRTEEEKERQKVLY